MEDSQERQRASVEDKFLIEIVNDDDGEVVNIGANGGTKISEVIAEMYLDFKLTHKANDRLICKSHHGADVFQFKDLNIHQYLETGQCPELKWKFAGETGGAAT